MEETFSSLVHPFLPLFFHPLALRSPPFPQPSRTPDREPRAPPTPRGVPLGSLSLRSSKHLSASEPGKAGRAWGTGARVEGPRVGACVSGGTFSQNCQLAAS
jgi:hypothetical protein